MRDQPAQLLALVWQPAKAKAQSPIIKIACFIVHPLTVLESLYGGTKLFSLALLVAAPFTGLVDAPESDQSGKREPCLERDERQRVHAGSASSEIVSRSYAFCRRFCQNRHARPPMTRTAETVTKTANTFPMKGLLSASGCSASLA